MSRHIQKIKNILKWNKKETKLILSKIQEYQTEQILAIYHPECLGIMNSTKDLFPNTIAIKELLNDKEIESIANAIANTKIKQIVFSSITFGWKALIEKIHEKNPQIVIKFFWHGSHAMFVQKNESYFLYQIIELLDRNIATSIAFAKESMADFYREKGYRSYFLPNTVTIKSSKNRGEKENGEEISIGLYSAGNRWEKNTFNQLSAISFIPNAIVDIIPATKLVVEFCKRMHIKILNPKMGYVLREDLLKRMAQNDVNLYVTFTECSPVVPLESLEMGVPCITGNNHHYFKDSKLYDYLVVKSEDDINEIAQKIKLCLEKKEEILTLYREWKEDYDSFVKQCWNHFIES